MRQLLLMLGLVAGCGSLDLASGTLPCSTDGRCPSGYHCAADQTCWQDGQDPDGGVNPMRDAGVIRDLTPPPDLVPVVTATPPAAVWMCAGGGSANAGLAKSQLNLSVGGSVVHGTAGSGGASISFSYFSSDTVTK